jgi:hypothetical protein
MPWFAQRPPRVWTVWFVGALFFFAILLAFGAGSSACGGDDQAASPFDAAGGPTLPDGAFVPFDSGAEAGPLIAPPTSVTALAGDQQATITWTDTASDVLDFTVTGVPGGTAKVSAPPATITGLTNGTKYQFTVVARTTRGTSAPSAPSNPITPAGVPGPPTDVAAVAGSESAVVSWSAPPDDGSPITSFTVTSSPGGLSASAIGTRSSVSVVGLTNGIAYTFTVVAVNAVGAGPPSAESSPVTPLPPPNAPATPTDVVATAGNGSVDLTWPAPNDKGLPITGYTIVSSPEGRKTTSTTPSATITDLTNGTSYTFTVSATNSAGTSLASAPSNPATPVGPPTAPLAVTAIRGDGSATVSWTAPNTGGHPITGYTVTSSPGGIVSTSTTTSVVVSGLTNGTPYRFTVVAANDLGPGPASNPSSFVTPAAVPAVPTGVTAQPGNGAAWVTWTAPADNGAAITSYTITASPGGKTATTNTVGGTVGGLANGTGYTFTVIATNAVGQSSASGSTASVIPDTCAQTTYLITNPGNGYVFSGIVGTDPVVTICRGQTYTFSLQNVNGHPFGILTGAFSFHSDVTNNGSQGTTNIVWTVASDEPTGAGTQYTCLVHPQMTNLFDIH